MRLKDNNYFDLILKQSMKNFACLKISNLWRLESYISVKTLLKSW